MSYWALIATADLANNAVTTAKIADDAITNAKIATGAVNSDSIADGSIVNADVNAAAAIAYSKLNLTGSIVFADFAASVTLDDFSVAGTIDMNSNQFSNLPAATASGQAVEYDQFVAAVDGLSYKEQARVATAAALPAYTRTANVITADANGALPSIDGVSLAASDRILVKNGAAGADNGIYVVTSLGSAGTPFVLTRADDSDTAASVDDGATVWVQQGTANADTRWTQVNTIATLNTDPLSYAQTGSATTVANIDDLGDVDTTGKVDGSLFRWEATASEWQATTGSTLLLSDAGQLLVPTTGATAGILLGGDAQLYRAGADLLRTPDSLTVDVDLTVSGLTVQSGGLRRAYELVTNHSVDLATDQVLESDSSGAARTVTLPASHNAGAEVTIKRNGANDVVIATADADTIDGAASYTIGVDLRSITVMSDGTNWIII